ncbi:MAG: hypothetical protein QW416_05280 [Candidatus Nitrosocaldaceae archaeon]
MKINIYSPSLTYLNIEKIIDFIKSITNVEIDRYEEFSEYVNIDEIIAEKIAKTRVTDYKKPFKEPVISKDDILSELRMQYSNNTYDGFLFQLIMNSLLKDYVIHIILTDRLLCTFDDNDYRYHLRSVIFGYPDIISIRGIVEAPAKPREYYIMAYKYIQEGKSIDGLEELFKDRIIGYDTRINNVIEGLILQILKYHIIGYPFCNNKMCRLYNAHWQEELINTQINGYICENDKDILQRIQ